MQLGVLGAWVNLDPMTPHQAAATAARLEQLGFSALWYPSSLSYDSLTRAASLLDATSNLVVATGITCIYDRPAWAAGAAQRVLFDQSDGRFLLGLGVSHKTAVEVAKRTTYGPPVATMRSYLSDLDLSVAERNQILRSTGGDDRPSLLSSRMPRVISALGPKMLELARNECDGVHPYLVTPEHTRVARDALGAERWICVEQTVVRERDATSARAMARRWLALYLGLPNYLASWRRLGFSDDDFSDGGSDRLVDALVAWGSDDALVRRLSDHFDAGATQVCVQALNAGDSQPATGPDWAALELVADACSITSASPAKRATD